MATVDLSAEFAAPGDLSGRFRVGQIVWTVTRLIQTAQVRILVDGRPVDKLGPDGFRAAGLWQRTMVALAGLWPQRSTVTGADRVLFVRKGEIYSVPPEAGQQATMVPLGVTGDKSDPSWSPDHRRIAFLVANEAGTSEALWVGQPGERKAVPAGLGARRLSPPSWSPDSGSVYTVSRAADGHARLNRFNLANWANEFVHLPPLPGGREPTVLEVSPDGAFVLALGGARGAEPEDGGQLYLGVLGPDGVTDWAPRPVAPGLGDIYSPVWVDPLTVAFIAQTHAKDDLGKLWIMKSDGWDPTPVGVDPSENAINLGNQLAVDPAGANFFFTVRSESGTSLWMVARQGSVVRPLTAATNNDFVTDPSFASR